MQQKIIVEITVDWEDYQDVDPELIFEDTGMPSAAKEGVTYKVLPPPSSHQGEVVKDSGIWNEAIEAGRKYQSQVGRLGGDKETCIAVYADGYIDGQLNRSQEHTMHDTLNGWLPIGKSDPSKTGIYKVRVGRIEGTCAFNSEVEEWNEDAWDEWYNEDQKSPAPPTPVEVDFEKAMTEKLDTIEENGIGLDSRWYNFEAGARWAWQHLASIPETAGPWHLKSHSNSEDDDTVWMTDGKLSIYIDEFNFDDFPEADYWLVNFLNKYQFKLSFDDQSPLIISHLEEQVKELQGRKGLGWVNPYKQMPPNDDIYDEPVKFLFRGKGDDPRSGWIEVDYLTHDEIEEAKTHYEYSEWLSDSPAPEQVDVDPSAFAEWVDIEAVRNGAHKWTIGAGDYTKHYTTDQLLELYKQQNKQG